MSFLNKYRGALGLENEDLEKEVDTEQEEQVEEQSEETTETETTETVEEKTEEQVEEEEPAVPAEPEETTEEAVQLDDSETPAAGGSRLQAYRAAAGQVEAEDEADKEETETTTEEAEEKTEETTEETSEEQTEEKADDESEETDESVKALESLRDEIMVSYQRGGMTEGEASMVNVAVNNILARNGLQAERVVPSIESFSENSTRRRLATSTTADMINRIISKIKK